MSDREFFGDYRSADQSQKNSYAFLYYGPGQRRRLTLPPSAGQTRQSGAPIGTYNDADDDRAESWADGVNPREE